MMDENREGRAAWSRRRWLTTFVVVAAIVGGLAVAVAVWARPGVPDRDSEARAIGSVRPTSESTVARPPSRRTPATPGRSGGATPGRTPTAAPGPPKPAPGPASLPSSAPVRLTAPAIGVDTAVTRVGLTAGNAIGVPSGARQNEAAWYDRSPTPGQFGPSVIVGHIDTVHGPSVFYRLGSLRPGDRVTVARADGTRAVFTVDGLRRYPDRTRLPIETIYGGDVGRPELRLMTCTDFDPTIHHYRGNTVVFAHLTAIHRG